MRENLLPAATAWLRRLPATALRAAAAAWAWYRELGHGNQRDARSLKLLREWLSPQQRVQYDRFGYFDVTGCHSGRRYRIRQGTASNIQELDESGRPRTGWCFVPRDILAPGDVMLAQKIALETDESGALAVARKFAPRWSAY
jgi:hypothetical protein